MELGVQGLGFGVWGLGFGVSGLGFGVKDFGFMLGIKVLVPDLALFAVDFEYRDLAVPVDLVA